MKKIFITVDVECHDINRKNQYIDGIHKKNVAGLKKILMIGKELNIPINFFFDIVEGMRYGKAYSMEIVKLIESYNQPIFLHLHPHYVSGDNNREFFWQYSHKEKTEILDRGFNYYKELTGNESEFFRIGCYGADEDMYKSMEELGIKTIDLSYCFNNPKMCHLDSLGDCSKNKIINYHNQIVFPNTRYVSFSMGDIVKCNNVDASETTINEWKRFLKKTKLNNITCTMHSWNFIKKFFFSSAYVRLDKAEVGRFKKMVAFAQEKGFIFSKLNKEYFKNISDDDELIDLCNGIGGKIQMLYNNYIRFRKIGRLNKKYFLIYGVFETLILLLFMGIFFYIIRGQQ